MFVPDFFLVGAPKCGTTSLSVYLRSHPNIFISTPKEPHFFNNDFLGSPIRTFTQYEACFRGRREEHQVIGDASAGYLISKVAIPQILSHRPESKFIAILRNPIDLVYSLHADRVYEGAENIMDFKKAWKAEGERLEGKKLPVGCPDPKRLYYSRYGLLGEQVQRLMSVAPRDQVLLLRFEEIVSNPQKLFYKVQAFLNVPVVQIDEFKTFNPHKKIRANNLNILLRQLGRIKSRIGFDQKWGIGTKIRNRFLASPSTRIPLDFETRKQLERFYFEDIRSLEQLTGWNLEDWIKTI